MPTIVQILSFYCLLLRCVAMNAVPFSVTVRLDGVAYYMHQTPEVGIAIPCSHVAEPSTVFHILEAEHLTAAWLNEEISRFTREDDVWNQSFLANIIFMYSHEKPTVEKEVRDMYAKWGTRQTYFLPRSHSELRGEGPYFLSMGRLHPAYRLYPDSTGAFVLGTVPEEDPLHYKAVDALAYAEQHPTALAIPVPSRLHSPKTPERPYAGTRIAVKDIIDLAGLKTGASSLAYTHLYGPRKANAVTVQRLLELGFVVVGKVKTTQFADSEWPTCDWVDYHAPFNPRADGYQTTSGSSAGSAAAIAAYDWLDYALGTDTLGSIRAPATAQGIYGMRPSLGAASFEGIIPYSPYFDTVGAFARDATSFATIARALYGSRDRSTCDKRPNKLLYPSDYWPVGNEESQGVFNEYIMKLESFLDVQRTSINLEEIWQKTNPLKTTQKLEDYVSHVFERVANPDQWNGFFRTFLHEYEKTYNHRPALNPQLQFKKDYLPTTLDPSQQEEALEALGVFKDWYEKYIVPAAKEGCLETLLLLPWSNGEPNYRDTYRESAQNFTGVGFFFYNISPYAQSPELIIPAGHTTFKSRITGREEVLPAGLGIIGGRGSDVSLAEFVAEFVTASGTEQPSSGNETREQDEDQFVRGSQQNIMVGQ